MIFLVFSEKSTGYANLKPAAVGMGPVAPVLQMLKGAFWVTVPASTETIFDIVEFVFLFVRQLFSQNDLYC